MMLPVVNLGHATINVRQDRLTGLTICLTCKGFKRLRVLDYHDAMGWVEHYEPCSGCGGRGLWWAEAAEEAAG